MRSDSFAGRLIGALTRSDPEVGHAAGRGVASESLAGRMTLALARTDTPPKSPERATKQVITAAAGATHELRLAAACVQLTNTLGGDFDAAEFLRGLVEQCVLHTGIDDVGVLLTIPHEARPLLVASTEQARLLVRFQVDEEDGPAPAVLNGGDPVDCADLESQGAASWPRFAAAAHDTGFRAVTVLPLQLRYEVIGAVCLFRTHAGPLSPERRDTAQTLADAATVGLLHERAVSARVLETEQLRAALASREIIEQAKGLLAGREGTSLEAAFSALRLHARESNRRLADVAQAVIRDDLDLSALVRSQRDGPTPG